MGGKKLLKQAWTWVELKGSHMNSFSASPLAPVFPGLWFLWLLSLALLHSTSCAHTRFSSAASRLTSSIMGAFSCQTGTFRDSSSFCWLRTWDVLLLFLSFHQFFCYFLTSQHFGNMLLLLMELYNSSQLNPDPTELVVAYAEGSPCWGEHNILKRQDQAVGKEMKSRKRESLIQNHQ